MDLNNLTLSSPIVMMALMALAAGWIANTVLGRRADLASSIVPGFLGGFVGAYIQGQFHFDFMRIGNPLIEQLAVAVMGALIVILAAGSVVSNRAR
ncbi:MAG: hypothetical protein JSS20_14625 [Proteobacteria bacterium]|nr:hypothetical protein [Pseudomonadota bacterium]